MLCEKNFDFKQTMFRLLVMVCVLCSAVAASAQGWRSGGDKSSSSSPGTVSKSDAPVAKATKAGKSTKPVRTSSSNATSSGQEPAAAAGAKTGTSVASSKGSRARVVGEAKQSSKASNASAGATQAKSTSTSANMPTTGRCDPEKDERTDLSGTYSGSIDYPAAGLAGDATLTINGNRFTLNSGSKSETGNISAITTCNYTAVALMFGEWKTPQPGEPVQPPLPMLSLRATRKGDKLTLVPSPSERRVFSFEPKK